MPLSCGCQRARQQFLDLRQQSVPVAQQVEQHHRHQQQGDDETEDGEASDLERGEQFHPQAVCALQVFGEQLSQPGGVELQIHTESGLEPWRQIVVELCQEARQAIRQQAHLLDQQRQQDQQQQHQQDRPSSSITSTAPRGRGKRWRASQLTAGLLM